MVAVIAILVVLAILVLSGSLLGLRLRRGSAAPAVPASRPPPAPPARGEADASAQAGATGDATETEAVPPKPEPGEPVMAETARPAPATVPSGPPRLAERLGKARDLWSSRIGAVISRSGIDAETWEQLEDALIGSDVGVSTTEKLLEGLRAQVGAGTIRDPAALVVAVREELVSRMSSRAGGLRLEAGAPNVWLFVGVNGVGKTTTIGKMGLRQSGAGRSVVMAAGDTFRAAAAEQLAQWADRVGSDFVRSSEGGDPGAVIFDAVQRAASRGADLVLADTAGRQHTRVNLMEELKKVRRVAERPPGLLTEVLLVIDATTGQNGLSQARQFTEAVGVTGIVLTKADGTAKGGIVVAIHDELGVPVKLVGVGEGPSDLVEFDASEFAGAIFDGA